MEPVTAPVLALAGTWQSWPGGNGSGGAPPFPNHDCVDLPLPVLDWDALRVGLASRSACDHTKKTSTLHCAATLEGWEDEILKLSRTWISENDWKKTFEAIDRIFPAAYAECPLGVVVLYIARILLCLLEGDLQCFVSHSTWISAELYKIPLTVVMGTEWPIFALLHSYDWSYPGIPRGNDYDCELTNRSTLDWPRLLEALQDDEGRPEASWWLDLLRYTFDNKLAYSMYASSFECLYGVYVLNMLKAMWSADTESSAFRIYEPYVQWIHYESLHLLGASGWRIFELLHHFTSLRRHNFRLDFTTQELAALPFRGSTEWLQSLPPLRHATVLKAQSLRFASQSYSDLRGVLTSILPHMEDSRLLYVTMVYGTMNRFIAPWAQRVKVIGLKSLVMATLDAEAYALCMQHHGFCVRGSISVLNKYTLLLVALQLGFDVMWLDFDIFLVRHPTEAVTMATAGYEMLMGYDLESDCLCNGFFFIRANEKTHRWLFEMVRWLYNHPYEHDQRAMGAFLNYTERISLDAEDLPPIPRWHVFDEENAFINYGPWLGNFDELVLVHFVDGSAFSLYGRPSSDPSVPLEKVASNTVETASSVMSDFYEPQVVQLPPQHLSLNPVGQRLAARRVSKPEKKQKCGILPQVMSAHSGYGWLAEHGSRAVPPEWHQR